MRILLDLNVWIDIAARRSKFPESRKLLKKLEEKHHEICLSLAGYTTFYYLLEQLIGSKGALYFCKLLKQRGVSLLSFSAEDVAIAQGLQFEDHEDACVAATALRHGCSSIVTRNLKDFRNCPVPVTTPSLLIKEL